MRIRILLGGVVLLGLVGAAQRDPVNMAKSLWLNATKEAWIFTAQAPDRFRFCALMEADGTLRGCVTAAELREKAATEQRAARLDE